MAMNISCKFEKASYNIFFVRAVTVKYLYTLRRRRRHNEVKSIVSTGYLNILCRFWHFYLKKRNAVSWFTIHKTMMSSVYFFYKWLLHSFSNEKLMNKEQ